MPKPLPEPITVGGIRAAAAEVAVSPLERRDPNSPKGGWKKRESGGIGLGIVAALGSNDDDGDRAARHVVNFQPFRRAFSPPLPIASSTAARTTKWSEEGGCASRGGRCWRVCRPVNCSRGISSGDSALFCVSPPRLPADGYAHFPATGFLTACYLCRKRLDGKDIYMYRGEKAFCSTECRHRQIVADEYQETCGLEASRPSDVSDSVHSGGRLFYAGVVAA